MNYRNKKDLPFWGKCLFFRKALFSMRCIVLFLFLGALQSLAAMGYSQITLLTLEKENATIREILSSIEQESEFYFTYNLSQIDVNKKTSVHVTDKNISEVLDAIFPGGDIKYTINDRHIVLYKDAAETSKTNTAGKNSAQQQERTITGTVVDNNGEPLIGVNIQINGTANGTITNLDGQFTLSGIASGSTLVVSYIGFVTQNIRIGNSTELKIVLLEDSKMIEDVVVVGYGTQRKETLTGAVSSIKTDEILTTKSDNVINTLQGKVSGLLIRQGTGEPGQYDSGISIRGFGDPLYVIDGIIIARDGKSEFARINPEDIENISILKDASASIYGMNASNGVVVVTTKRGQTGQARVSYSGMFSLTMPTGMPNLVSSYEDRLIKNEFRRNVGQQPSTSAEDLEHYKNGDEGYPDFDWIDAYLKDATPAHSHNLSVRGGNDKINYYTSLGYRRNNGFIKNGLIYDEQYTLRNNFSAQLTKELKMNFNMSGRVDKRQNGVEPWIWTYKTLIVNDRGVEPYTLADNGHLSAVGPENKNPEALISPTLLGYNLTEKINGNTTLDFVYSPKFAPGLSVTLLGSFEFASDKEMKYRNTYQIYNYKTDLPVGQGSGNGENSYQSQMWLYKRTYGKIQLDYEKTFGDHALKGTFVAEASQRKDDMLLGKRLYVGMFTFEELNQATASTATNEGTRGAERYAAFIGRLNYNYQQKYLLEAMVRYDGSYKYSPRKMWSTFPSVSVGWRISEESFMKDNLTWLENLKLRASYGSSGKDQGDYYEWLYAYNNSQDRGYTFNGTGWTNGMIPPGVVNDLLTWRRSTITNVGLDFTVLRNLDMSIEWFERRNTGVLAFRVVTTPNTFGASLPKENVDSEMNNGFDLEVKYRGKAGKDFKYTLGANVTFARFKYLHVERAPFTSQWDKWRNSSENRYTGRLSIYTWDGRYTSIGQYNEAPLVGSSLGNTKMLPGSYRIQDNNGDGRINGDDMIYNQWTFGNEVNPPLQFGFNANFSYKSWDLAMTFQGASLYSVAYRHDDTMGYGERYPTTHRRFFDRWHTAIGADGNPMDPLNPSSTWIPGLYPAGRPNFNNTSDGLMIDVWRPNATYLRMKNIELGYTLPKSAMNVVGLNNLRLYVNATNMLTFAADIFKEIDPEKREGDYNNSLSYPLMKSVNFGVNISF